MKRKNNWVKIMAFLALFWIVIWIIWTWVLVLFSWNNNSSNEQTISPEQYLEVQNLINAQTWATINTVTWTKTLSWETK